MVKDKVTDQFSDDEMNQIKHYGQMLGGGVTPYDEAVEEALNKRQAAREANAKNMRVAQTGGGDIGLGPSQIERRYQTARRHRVPGGHQREPRGPGRPSPTAFFRACTSSCRAR
jgi:hypothetical protein